MESVAARPPTPQVWLFVCAKLDTTTLNAAPKPTTATDVSELRPLPPLPRPLPSPPVRALPLPLVRQRLFLRSPLPMLLVRQRLALLLLLLLVLVLLLPPPTPAPRPNPEAAPVLSSDPFVEFWCWVVLDITSTAKSKHLPSRPLKTPPLAWIQTTKFKFAFTRYTS